MAPSADRELSGPGRCCSAGHVPYHTHAYYLHFLFYYFHYYVWDGGDGRDGGGLGLTRKAGDDIYVTIDYDLGTLS